MSKEGIFLTVRCLDSHSHQILAVTAAEEVMEEVTCWTFHCFLGSLNATYILLTALTQGHGADFMMEINTALKQDHTADPEPARWITSSGWPGTSKEEGWTSL